MAFLPSDNRITGVALSAHKPTACPPVLNSVKTQKCQINRNIDPLVKNKQTAAAGGGEGEIDFCKREERIFVEWDGS